MLRALVWTWTAPSWTRRRPSSGAWEEVDRWWGAGLPQEEWLKAVGSSQTRFDPVAYLAHQLGQAVDRAQVEERRTPWRAQRCGQLGPRPGVVELVHAAQQSSFSWRGPPALPGPGWMPA